MSGETGELQAQTWHYGLIAKWWAEFNDDFRPHEIPYFQRQIERGGEPALDVGCGAGRLLIPYLRAGLDVDPEAEGRPRSLRTASDGTMLGLRTRIVELDPLAQRVTYEMHAEQWRDGELVAEEDRLLRLRRRCRSGRSQERCSHERRRLHRFHRTEALPGSIPRGLRRQVRDRDAWIRATGMLTLFVVSGTLNSRTHRSCVAWPAS